MRIARIRANKTLAEVAEGVSKLLDRKPAFTPQAAKDWEIKSSISKEGLVQFARFVDADLLWLLVGGPERAAGGFGHTPPQGRTLPMLKLSQAIARPINYSAERTVHSHFECSEQAFAMMIFDNRNAPKFAENEDSIVIDPALTPRPGDMVLAVVGGKGCFGRYTMRKGGVIEIEALNDHWATEVFDATAGDRIVGVMTEHASPRR